MKPMVLPAIYLARHGETAWSLTGQHTGLTDVLLTERGERNARQLGRISRFNEFLGGPSRGKPLKRLAGSSLISTWLKRGVNEKAARGTLLILAPFVSNHFGKAANANIVIMKQTNFGD